MHHQPNARYLQAIGRLRRGHPGTYAAAVTAITAAACAVILPSYYVASLIMVFALAGMCSNLMAGYGGLLSFAQGAFFGVGAYVGGYLAIQWDLPILPILVSSIISGAVVAAGVGFVAIRRRGVYFVMLTYAVAALFGYLVYVLSDATGGENGLQGVPVPHFGFGGSSLSLGSERGGFILVSVALGLGYCFFARLLSSPFGYILRALRENEDRTLAVGYDVRQIKLLAFTLSGGITGACGALYVLIVAAVPPSAIDLDMSLQIFIITIIGGSRSLYGGFLGSAFYVLISQYISNVWDRWELIMGVALLASVFFLKEGLVSLPSVLRGAIVRQGHTDHRRATGHAGAGGRSRMGTSTKRRD